MNLVAYFRRIGFAAPPRPDLETLRILHRLHPSAIPFENLSTLIGDPVSLDVQSLEDKLVRRRRGGYCFEQNTLFKAALEAIGFDLVPLAARVVWGRDESGAVNPRTHMILIAEIDDGPYLCDVGFGGATLTAPLSFELNLEQSTPHDTFRLVRLDPEYELQVRLGGAWRPMYQFDLQPQLPIDYEALNHFVATHASSHFRTQLMAARPHADGRYALSGAELTSYERGRKVGSRRLTGGDELRSVLTDSFGIALPTDGRLDEALARIAGGTPEKGDVTP